MLDWHALRGAGRTRGIHDTAEIFRGGWDEVNGILFSKLTKLLEAVDAKVGVSVKELVYVFLLDIVLAVPDDMLDILGLFERADERRQKVGIEEDGLGPGGHQ